jgi:hypothetical protein
VLGFPIRTSADQSPIDGSPQLFAVIHVLHRFLAPRHPPLALCSLEEQRCSCLLCSSQRATHNVCQPHGIDPMRPSERSTSSGADAAAAELESSCRAWSERPSSVWTGRLPQNGREDKDSRFDIERRTDPATLEALSTDPPVHQLGTGSNRTGRMPAND